MSLTWFVTHADVVIDPDIAVTDWPLNARGQARHSAFAEHWKAGRAAPAAIWSSTERKARDGAQILGDALGITPRTDAGLGENDRSATGFIPEPRFSEVASDFFAHPRMSVLGWERAVDAQTRIVAAVNAAREQSGPGDIVILSHGGVGALLMAHLMQEDIREALGPNIAGGGAVCAFDRSGLRRGWRPIESENALDLTTTD